MLNQTAPPSGIVIQNVEPQIDCGRYPVKREVGDVLQVSADIFREGHDQIAAVVRYCRASDTDWAEADMHFVDNDRWAGSFLLAGNTRYLYTIEAFPDRYGTWRDEITKKLAAGFDVTSERLEGETLLQETAAQSPPADRALIKAAITAAERAATPATAVGHLLTDDVAQAVQRNRLRTGTVRFDRELTVIVDRVRARYAAWYEFFPRSAGRVPGQGGTFADAQARLPAIAEMGFDVVYFPPIHPIGHSHRKGPNNTLVAGPEDPGVPYAIGNELGGHDAIEPALGTLEDFRQVVSAAEALGMEIALDFAIQTSPDHPWVREHPEWFYIRPDGTIKYAENPPKKYEDIYPINFNSPDWRNLWLELKRIVLFWVEQGVKTFRVDNPHTKPVAFWEWLIDEVQHEHPEVLFLSEAFTRPKVMKTLAKAGFSQSYTYFTWRNFKQELIDYFTELTQTDVNEYLRGNLFTNTPDILPYILQDGGRPAFRIRATLAATLSSLYGIYSGFELCEAVAIPGKEEYANSEKYEYKVWDWDRPGNIIAEITTLNRIRHEHPALHEYDNLRFIESDDDNILCYYKTTPDRSDTVVVAVNLDPFQPHTSGFELPLAALGIPADVPFRVTELMTDTPYLWTGPHQTITLDPHEAPAKIFEVQPWLRIDYVDPCY